MWRTANWSIICVICPCGCGGWGCDWAGAGLCLWLGLGCGCLGWGWAVAVAGAGAVSGLGLCLGLGWGCVWVWVGAGLGLGCGWAGAMTRAGLGWSFLRLSSMLSVLPYLSLKSLWESNYSITTCYFPILKQSWVKLKNCFSKHCTSLPTLHWKSRDKHRANVQHTTTYLWQQTKPYVSR